MLPFLFSIFSSSSSYYLLPCSRVCFLQSLLFLCQNWADPFLLSLPNLSSHSSDRSPSPSSTGRSEENWDMLSEAEDLYERRNSVDSDVSDESGDSSESLSDEASGSGAEDGLQREMEAPGRSSSRRDSTVRSSRSCRKLPRFEVYRFLGFWPVSFIWARIRLCCSYRLWSVGWNMYAGIFL